MRTSLSPRLWIDEFILGWTSWFLDLNLDVWLGWNWWIGVHHIWVSCKVLLSWVMLDKRKDWLPGQQKWSQRWPGHLKPIWQWLSVKEWFWGCLASKKLTDPVSICFQKRPGLVSTNHGVLHYGKSICHHICHLTSLESYLIIIFLFVLTEGCWAMLEF